MKSYIKIQNLVLKSYFTYRLWASWANETAHLFDLLLKKIFLDLISEKAVIFVLQNQLNLLSVPQSKLVYGHILDSLFSITVVFSHSSRYPRMSYHISSADQEEAWAVEDIPNRYSHHAIIEDHSRYSALAEFLTAHSPSGFESYLIPYQDSSKLTLISSDTFVIMTTSRAAYLQLLSIIYWKRKQISSEMIQKTEVWVVRVQNWRRNTLN